MIIIHGRQMVERVRDYRWGKPVIGKIFQGTGFPGSPKQFKAKKSLPIESDMAHNCISPHHIIHNFRPTFEINQTEPESQNYYPVASNILIKVWYRFIIIILTQIDGMFITTMTWNTEIIWNQKFSFRTILINWLCSQIGLRCVWQYELLMSFDGSL